MNVFFTGEGKAKWLKGICLQQVQAGTWHLKKTPASPKNTVIVELYDRLVHHRHDCTCKERTCLVAFFWDITELGSYVSGVHSKGMKEELQALTFGFVC